MYNLLRFIKINHFLLLFILIEGLSVSLLLNNNSYQQNRFLNLSTEYTSPIRDYAYSLSNYLELKEINNYLTKENAKLHSLLRYENQSTDFLLASSKQYNYLSSKVINNSISKRNNFITLDKGYKDGISEGMGVVTKEGVIGVIYSVSRSFSVAISLLNSKSAIGIQLKKNNHNGILKWQGFNYRKAVISNFPNHIPIELNDTIISNSHSVIFPEGINIGRVADIKENKDEGFFNVTVSLFEDFNKLNYVYIIHSNESAEQLSLEKAIKSNE